jgi:hypothetical protein
MESASLDRAVHLNNRQHWNVQLKDRLHAGGDAAAVVDEDVTENWRCASSSKSSRLFE